MNFQVLSLLSGIAIGAVLSALLHPAGGFEVASYIAQIITAASVFIAASSFWYQIKHDKFLSVTNQIGFFRTTVMSLHEERYEELNEILGKEFLEKNPQKRIPEIEEFTFEWFEEWRHEEIKSHIIIDRELGNKLRPFHQAKAVSLLNAMEQFSLDIKINKTIDDPALKSIRSSFILLVEENAYVLAYKILESDDSDIYFAIKEIYFKWSPEISRKPTEKIAAELEQQIFEGRNRRRAREAVL